jgi:Fimbrial assembly protein (PilN).
MNLRSSTESRLVLGGVPRVNLLPPEVGLAAKSRSLRIGLSLLVVASMVIVGAGYGVASLHASSAQHALDVVNQRTAELLAQQKKYVEVRKVTSDLALTTAARQVGSSTEVNWKSYFESVQASLPGGTTIVTFTATTGSPLVEFTQPTVPLQGERIAELTFSAETASLPDVPAWLNALASLKGFVDASPGSVTLNDGVYTAAITMHINEKALANRFPGPVAKTDGKASADGAATGTATDASKAEGK